MLPVQYRVNDMGFVLIAPNEKKPVGLDWNNPNKKHLSFRDVEDFLQKNPNYNYGVLCGFGDYLVVDVDRHNEMTFEVLQEKTKLLPKTFVVETPNRGLHFYYKIKNPENAFFSNLKVNNEDAGEIRWLSVKKTYTQVLGVGSKINGKEYKILVDEQIAVVDFNDLLLFLAPFVFEIQNRIIRQNTEHMLDVKISDVFDYSGFFRHGVEYYGAHPVHGSESGKNFWINEEKNTWYCFRHHVGGSAVQLFAVLEGIVDCEHVRDLKGFLFVDCVKRLEKKLGVSILKNKSGVLHANWDMLSMVLNSVVVEDKIIYVIENDTLFRYSDSGVYEPCEFFLKAKIQEKIGDSCRTHHVHEVIEAVKRKTSISLSRVLEKTGSPFLIPCEDCVVDSSKVRVDANLNIVWDDDAFIDYSPDMIFFKKHPIYSPKYVKDSGGNLFVLNNKINKYVAGLFDNQVYEVLVKEILGYCFYRDVPFHNFFLFVGAGANGKSTLLQVFENCLGSDFVSNVSLQELVNNRFAGSELYLKNANISADLPATSLTSSGYLKQLTGGDFVFAEKKFKEPFKFKNYAKLIFSCNQIPEIGDESDAIYRRAVIVPFAKSFVENPNRNIVKELTDDELELSVFAWVCISAFNDALTDNCFIYNPTISETKKMFKSYSNNVSVFADEFLEYDPDAEISTEAVYFAYQNFCKKNKLPVFDERTFGKTLFKEFGHKIYKKRVYTENNFSNKISNTANKRYYIYRCLDFKQDPCFTEEQVKKLNNFALAHWHYDGGG